MTLTPILAKPYVEQRDTGYWIEGTRISLDKESFAIPKEEGFLLEER